MHLLVVAAIRAEAAHVPEDLEVLVTGVGKTLAAVQVTRAICEHPRRDELVVVNIGTAGALRDGLNAIGFADKQYLRGRYLDTPRDAFLQALDISCYSLIEVARRAHPLMADGGSLITLTYGGSNRVTPFYNVMGVAKAALESTVRYLANDLGPDGIRCNLVAAGPIRTTAAKSIPGFEQFEESWDSRSPLGWDVGDPVPTAKACVALLSDWFPATTGEILHVDGGVHAMGI